MQRTVPGVCWARVAGRKGERDDEHDKVDHGPILEKLREEKSIFV
jgi:hypothetical protein